MPTARQSWVNANQFTPTLSTEVDFEVNTANIPVGSTLLRTWVDVRFNRFGFADPPEFVNECGPMMWGLCYVDPTTDNPGVFAEDDGIDWLWREMIAFGPAVVMPQIPGDQPEWMQVSIGPNGLRDSKGKRKLREAPAFLHWCFDLPTLFSSDPPGISWEVMVHTLWETA